MDALITLGILAVVLIGVVAPILSILGFVGARRLRAEVAALGRRLEAVERGLSRPQAAAAPETDSPPDAVPDAAPEPEESPVATEPPTPWTQRAANPPPPASPAATDGASGLDRFERQVTLRWFVWLGAATLGLAAVFLVKEAAERGWLGPGVRVALGFLTGLALIAAGEWVRRRFPGSSERGKADYVPPALCAGGFLSCYASLYAAGQLFGFLTPGLTFAFMTLVVVACGLMAMLHGPFLALLGAVGGFVLPALIRTDEPNGWVLFLYLAAMVAGALETTRRRPWLWLGWIALAAAIAWSLLWIDLPRTVAPAAPLALFLVLALALFLEYAPMIGRALAPDDATRLPWWRDPQPLALAAGIAVAALGFGLVRIADYDAAGLGAVAALAALMTLGARRHAPLEYLAVVAAALTVAALATWHLPAILGPYAPIVYEGNIAGLGWAPHVPPEARSFLTACAGFGAAHAVAGFAGLWGARRPALWAAVSAAVPLLLMVAAYGRIARFEIDLGWSSAALVLAVVALAAAARLAPWRDAPEAGNALGIYAAAVTAAIALAATMALRDAWLTVALSLELPALAWIHRRLPVESLRAIAGIVAVALCARLAFNPDVFTYVGKAALGEHWPLYGYGIPLAATYLAWRHFARAEPDWLDAWLRALCFGLAALLVAFELRAAIRLGDPATDMATGRETMGVIGWLAIATGLAGPVGRGAALVRWTRRLLLGLAALAIALLPLALDNPVWRHFSVGPWPVANALLLAYLAPAALLLAFARAARAVEPRPLVFATAGLALICGFAWVTLETRHAFRGAVLADGGIGDAESYAYSAVWLLYAGALLAGGLWQKSQALRIGSLVVVMAAVLKVFLVDMDDLEGLWRVASFFGLGLALVGIGFLYQRLVFRRPDPLPAAEA